MGTGILVLTDQRLLFLKDGVLFKRSEDFPLDKIISVQWSSGPMFGKITVVASGNLAVIDNLEKPDGLAICEAIRAHLVEPARPQDVVRPTVAAELLELLAQLGELHKAGVLTDAEFTAKKAELLRRI